MINALICRSQFLFKNHIVPCLTLIQLKINSLGVSIIKSLYSFFKSDKIPTNIKIINNKNELNHNDLQTTQINSRAHSILFNGVCRDSKKDENDLLTCQPIEDSSLHSHEHVECEHKTDPIDLQSEAKKAKSQKIQLLMKQANQHLKQDQMEEAINNYREVLAIESQLEALQRRPHLLLQKGQYTEALTYLNMILCLDPQNIEALLAKGHIWLQLRIFNKAEMNFKKVLTLNPENFEAIEGLAKAKFLGTKLSQVDDVFHQTISVNSTQNEKENAILGHLKTLIKNDKFSEVHEFVDHFFNNNPLRISLLLEFASELHKTRQYTSAAFILKKITEIDPQNIRALINYAKCLIKLNKFEEAENIFKDICISQSNKIDDKDYLEALKGCAKTLFKKKNYLDCARIIRTAEKLCESLQKEGKIQKDDPDIIKRKAKLALKRGNHTKDELLALANNCFQKPHIQSLKPVPLNLLKPLSDYDQEMIDQLLDTHQGFCIGEYHSDHSPKDFLIQHMGYLKQKGVKVLFMEQFYDDLQIELDLFSYDLAIPNGIKANIANATYKYGFLEVLQAAKENQIRVIAIDTRVANITDHSERWTTMNYFAYKIMKETIRSFNPQDKYVALMGAGHLSRRKGTILGVAELMQSPRVSILDRKRVSPQINYKSRIFTANHLPQDKEIEIDLVVLE